MTDELGNVKLESQYYQMTDSNVIDLLCYY